MITKNNIQRPKISVECNRPLLGGFPEASFGLHNNIAYFDATHIISHHTNKSIDEFLAQYQPTIQKIQDLHNFPLIAENNNSHVVLAEILFPTLIGYLTPQFSTWCSEMIIRLLRQGFACSDSFILQSAMEQLDLDRKSVV